MKVKIPSNSAKGRIYYPINRKKQLETRICKMSFVVVHFSPKRQSKEKYWLQGAILLQYFLVRQQSS